MPTQLPPALIERLARLGQGASEDQRKFMQSLASREREPKGQESLVSDLEQYGAPRLAAVKFFKQLESIECGKFLPGRRGGKSRLIWRASAIEIGKAFLRSTNDGMGSSFAPESPDGSSESESPLTWHSHEFLLRPNVKVTLRLPLDLTGAEASRIAEFVRAIPFSDTPSTSTQSPRS